MVQMFGIQEIQTSEGKVHFPFMRISRLFPLTGQVPTFHLGFLGVLQTWCYIFLLRLNRSFICIYKILILKLELGRRMFIIVHPIFFISEIFD